MSKRSRRTRRERRSRSRAAPSETPLADMLTASWSLTIVTAILCELFTLLAILYASRGEPSQRLEVLIGLLLVGCFVFGAVALLLTPVVLWIRRERPPLPVTIAAVAVGIVPLLLFRLQS